VGPEVSQKGTFSRMGVRTLKFGAFFLESTCFMNVETVFTKSTVREVLALNMLGKIKSQIEWVSLFFVNFAFGDMRLF
jgi:hypothetical protein